MNRTIKYRQRYRKTSSGFTLILTILLASLLSILVVSALIEAQIEEQAEYSASQEEIARQNALFGLNQALNQIQTAAGPDRRTTARADILNSTNTGSANGYSGQQPASDSGQCFWTGVWKNTFNDFSGCAGNGLVANPDPFPGSTSMPGPGGSFFYYDYLPNGSVNPGTSTIPNRTGGPYSVYNNANVSWLVSWPNSSQPDPTQSLVNQGISSSQLVTVINNLNSNATSIGSTSVSVPKVAINALPPGSNTPSRVGSFAYWVSDEGVKARVDIQDPYLTSSTINQQLAHFQIAQSPAANLGLGLNSAVFPTFSTAPMDLRNQITIAPTLAALCFGDSGHTWSDFATNSGHFYSSDFTVDSLGVIADSFNGGLRKDLTAAFEYPSLYVKNFGDNASFDGQGVGGSGYESLRKVFSTSALSQKSYGILSSGVSVCGINNVPYAGAANGNDMILDGLRWDSLFYFYNTYHKTIPSPVLSPASNAPSGIGSTQTTSEAGTGTIPSLSARFYQEIDPNNASTFLNIDGVMPIRVLWNFNAQMSLHPLGPNTSPPYTFDFILGMTPTVVMYNPYDVALKMPLNSTLEWHNDVNNRTPSTATIWFKQPVTATVENSQVLTFVDEDFQISYDSVPYTPGELRTYGIANDNAINTTQVLGRDGEWAYFCPDPHNNIDLVSQGVSINACQYEEITLPTPISVTNLNDNVIFNFVDYVFTSDSKYFPSVIAEKFPLWPSSGGTSSATLGATAASRGSYMFGSNPEVGTGTASTQIPIGTVSGLTSSIPLITLASFVDRVAGFNSPTFLPCANTDNAANQFSMGIPGWAAGGALLNPLNIDVNGYSRDYEHSQMQYGFPYSATDLNFVTNASNSNVCETGWLPNAVGKDAPPTTSGTPRIFYDLPRHPLISMGQFKNMYCHYFTPTQYQNEAGDYVAGTPANAYYTLDFPAYPVGDSYQEGLPTYTSFALPSQIGSTALEVGAVKSQLIDCNFLANQTLFDGYFLSTVPPVSLTDSAAWAINTSNFNQSYISSNYSLPNSRFVYYARPQFNSGSCKGSPVANSTSPNITDLQPTTTSFNLRKPAANLLINGAFNINSTSIPAWTALLTSECAQSNNTLALFSLQSNNPGTAKISNNTFTSNEVPFLHFMNGFGPTVWNGSGDNNVPWFGMTDLKTSSVQSLAAQFVAQVKARGPFLSLGDFLNHQLTAAPNALSASGAIQSAIDAQNINNAMTTSVSSQSSFTTSSNAHKIQTPLTCSYPSGFSSNVLPTTPSSSGAGIPGTLLQSDIVQLIAPVIASRSDTFMIRAYGESLSPSKAIQGRAWCEAVIQRVPEYVYSSENGVLAPNGNCAYDEPSQSFSNSPSGTTGISPINSVLGRRFKLVSFRWLNQNEL